ncbi:acyl-CoA synthetase [Aestuariispira insulae]|uniref:Acetyl-CoA synthetase n=1 Tax=Aestuariispira insulae TaxID=1461337 RepID=A0A3D9HX17_9PROT|nr:acyl-CoA synthetase [Aestuariispira insulae]RED54037.1 acetyl-CoA synthetase [Aestuariispira insulae]
MLKAAGQYGEVYDSFQWQIPEYYNIGVDICDRQNPAAKAIIFRDQDGQVRDYSFGDLKALSNRFANLLSAHGAMREDRLAILLPQAPETAIAHIAAYKSGMIAVPLFVLFGEEALEYRLSASGARFLVTDKSGVEKIATIRDRLPALEAVFCIDGSMEDAQDFHALLERSSDRFEPVPTKADDPALIIFTSGTTGNPKGALHAHRVLLGHLPGVEFPHNFFPQDQDLFWTPADWAWIGGLIDVLLPSLHHGKPVLAYRAAKFDPEEAFRLMADFKVRNVFMPPTALKLMRQVEKPRERFSHDLRSIGSGGESLGAGLLDWGRETFGININEFYGQTECNLVVGCCEQAMDIRPGSMGKPIPGHQVEVIDADGNVLPAGEQGLIAVRRPDPVMFLRYWQNEQATAEKFIGDWLLTGDTGKKDEDGYLWYIGRDDDVITTAGYRVGPGEIEDCLINHPAVQLAAVIGVPDPIRTQSVKAYIVLRDGFSEDETLTREIQTYVKTKLAAHEYPRAIAYVRELPMTTTGKVMRRKLRDLPENS